MASPGDLGEGGHRLWPSGPPGGLPAPRAMVSDLSPAWELPLAAPTAHIVRWPKGRVFGRKEFAKYRTRLLAETSNAEM
jgi:hypothetical protein